MKVTVDMDVCEFHGQCTISAPDVFSLPSMNTLEYDESPSEEYLDEVEEAVDVCPAQAILLEKGN